MCGVDAASEVVVSVFAISVVPADDCPVAL